jgi:hypothetical protein
MTANDLVIVVIDDAMSEMDDEMIIMAATIFAMDVRMKNMHDTITHTVNSFRMSPILNVHLQL